MSPDLNLWPFRSHAHTHMHDTCAHAYISLHTLTLLTHMGRRREGGERVASPESHGGVENGGLNFV